MDTPSYNDLKVWLIQCERTDSLGKEAEKKLIECGYFDAAGRYQNSTNPVFRSVAKWYDKTRLGV